MVLKHRPGRYHGNADSMSRIPVSSEHCNAYVPGVKPSDLPCGGCTYCTRADKNWGSFSREVDDSVTIASPALQIIGANDQDTQEYVTGDFSIGTGEYDQVNPGECCLSTIELEQVQNSHLTPNQLSQTPIFGRKLPIAKENLTKLHTGSLTFRDCLTKLHSGTSTTHKKYIRDSCFEVPSENPEGTPGARGSTRKCSGKKWGIEEHVDLNQVNPEEWNKDTGGNVQSNSGEWDKSPSGNHQGIFKDSVRGYLEYDQVEPGVCQGGGISQRPENLQTMSQLDTTASAAKLLGCKSQEKLVHVDIVTLNGAADIRTQVISLGATEEPSCWGFSLKDLKEAQACDENLQIILDWVKTGNKPEEGVLFLASPAAKSYWLNKEQFLLIDEVLYKSRNDTDEKDLVMPTSLKEEAIQLSHDIPSAEHQGVARTKARMKEKFYWYGMVKDIANYVTTCEICNRNKKHDRYGKTPMIEYQAGAPMERVHIDFLGPLPKPPRGNENILMMVDQFTKWVECIPLPSQTAEVTAKAAVDHFFSRFGYPFHIFSDQGRNFESKLFAALCNALQIHKSRTTTYRPSANGQAERYNRTLMDAERCFIGKSQNQWDLHLQQIAGALRSSVNRSTGYTANMMMLGREVNLPAHLMFPQAQPSTKDDDTDGYVAQLTRNIQKTYETARSTLKTSLRRMKRDYDLRILHRSYEEGDLVYLLDTASVKGKCKKLSSPWKGPAVITCKISGFLFRVKLKNAIFVVNHDRLKPCKDRQVPGWVKHWRENPDVRSPDQGGDDNDVYCLCRKPWQGRFMIQCDYCDEWYHGSCVDVTAADALEIDKYKCGLCKAQP